MFYFQHETLTAVLYWGVYVYVLNSCNAECLWNLLSDLHHEKRITQNCHTANVGQLSGDD